MNGVNYDSEARRHLMNIFPMMAPNIPILILLVIIVQSSSYFSIQAKSVEVQRIIHLLKLKRGVISFDCSAVLISSHMSVPYKSKSAKSSLSDVLLTSAYCLHQKNVRLGKMYVANATQLSALFIERTSNGKIVNHLELKIKSYLIHPKYLRWFPHDTVNVALIRPQTHLSVAKSLAAIPVSHFSLDKVSSCSVTGRLLSITKDRESFFSKILEPRVWSLTMCQCRQYLNESGYVLHTVQMFVEPHKCGKFLEVDVIEPAQRRSSSYNVRVKNTDLHGNFHRGSAVTWMTKFGRIISSESWLVHLFSFPIDDKTFCAEICSLLDHHLFAETMELILYKASLSACTMSRTLQ